MTRRAVLRSNRDHASNIAGGLMPARVALLLGAFIVLSAGFAPIGAIHNAAHDARHAFAFPCH
jgi:cobalt transporter subunit CbtB